MKKRVRTEAKSVEALGRELAEEIEAVEATLNVKAKEDHDAAKSIKDRLPKAEEEARKIYAQQEAWAQSIRDESLREADRLNIEAVPRIEALREKLLASALELYRQNLAKLDIEEADKSNTAHKSVEIEAHSLMEGWISRRTSTREQWRKQTHDGIKAALSAREKIASEREISCRQAYEAWERAIGETGSWEAGQINHLGGIAEGRILDAVARMKESLYLLARQAEEAIRSASKDHVRLGEILSRDVPNTTADLMSPLEMIRADEQKRAQTLAEWEKGISDLSEQFQKHLGQILAQHRSGVERALVEMTQETQENREMEERGYQAVHRESQARRDAANQGLLSDLDGANRARDVALSALMEEEEGWRGTLEEEMAGDPPPLEEMQMLFSRHEADMIALAESFARSRADAGSQLEKEQVAIEEEHYKNAKAAQDALVLAKKQAIEIYRQQERDAWREYQSALAALNAELEAKLGPAE